MSLIRGIVKEMNSYVESSATKGTISKGGIFRGKVNTETINTIVHKVLIGDAHYVEFKQDIFFSVGDDVLVSGTEHGNIFHANTYHNLTKNKTVLKSVSKPTLCGIIMFVITACIIIDDGLIRGRMPSSFSIIISIITITISVSCFLSARAAKLSNNELKQELEKIQAQA
jgi:hypothetical protein